MYVLRNALRCISRSKGRTVLIAIIVLVLAISSCVGLSIRRAAEKARTETLATLSVTATISYDRRGAMQSMVPPDMSDGGGSGFDRDKFQEMMTGASSLTLDEYLKYAKASSVEDFYYSYTVGFNGGEDLEPVSTQTDTDTDTDFDFGGGAFSPFGSNGMGGGKDMILGAQSDFSVVGYSGEDAMTAFINGEATVTSGAVFTEGTDAYECIITEELATYNDVSVGDTIVISNPNNEEEVYTLTVTGLYTDTSSNVSSFSVMGMNATDPANRIYVSYQALKKITEASKDVSTTQTDQTTGREFETALSGDLSATYVLKEVESYETFQTQVYEMGLDESYTVSSSDITAFENSMTPLNTLSTTAGYFLIVILLIGAVILIVLNIFSVRERKYEIGVLTAMGMKKTKVALQFLTEIFVVTVLSVMIGAGVGAVTSVPIANALLEGQSVSQQQQFDRVEQSFGRGEMPSGIPEMPQGGDMPFGERFENMIGDTAEYITEIQAATDLVVLGQMLILAVVLTVIAGAASMLFIMRYEPLKILSNRD